MLPVPATVPVPPPWPFYPTFPAVPPLPPVAPGPAPLGTVGLGVQASTVEPKAALSEREIRILKRKQANRDSARRSKLRKKAANEELQDRSHTLHEEHSKLKTLVQDARAKVMMLQETNMNFRKELDALGVKVPI